MNAASSAAEPRPARFAAGPPVAGVQELGGAGLPSRTFACLLFGLLAVLPLGFPVGAARRDLFGRLGFQSTRLIGSRLVNRVAPRSASGRATAQAACESGCADTATSRFFKRICTSLRS